MFEIPSAKRVRRDELQSPRLSPRSSPDPDLTDLLRSRSHNDYTFAAVDSNEQEDNVEGAQSDQEETELILFGGPSGAPQQLKIRLKSPEPEAGDAGFTVRRPRKYYFADELDSEREAQLKTAAVDGDAVLEMARIPWPGCALPWKVRAISAKGIRRTVLMDHPRKLVTVEEKIRKKKRKGKKTRIAMRKKLQARTGKEIEEDRLAKEKEDAEREKRTLRNREKKLKKKARDKAKKSLADPGEPAASQTAKDDHGE
ncbi:hypothetical protein BU24DRAFT_491791 [Aaosphaeria arxii CBS 175.79]|uniref:Uncharacterized protein n=1 Tax=Aaosphaeria arxii CBS 175.79 TaxID=1450172 RepID=A0A6A5XRM8_9PLEO|nr:uncharacterized protein BU24DRAFT_491791 [Aaosphaeria arxii CBS 175.79]KAF2015559.1 hypothetical protein BU24DRAFT_491791 [Aaosphaeria arxii CBS 175.79]